MYKHRVCAVRPLSAPNNARAARTARDRNCASILCVMYGRMYVTCTRFSFSRVYDVYSVCAAPHGDATSWSYTVWFWHVVFRIALFGRRAGLRMKIRSRIIRIIIVIIILNYIHIKKKKKRYIKGALPHDPNDRNSILLLLLYVIDYTFKLYYTLSISLQRGEIVYTSYWYSNNYLKSCYTRIHHNTWIGVRKGYT